MRVNVGVRLLMVLAVALSAQAVVADATPKRNAARPNVSVREQHAIYGIARAVRRAVLTNRPAVVCSLLTRRAQRHALNYDNGFKPVGLVRADPTTCEQAVANFIADLTSSGDISRARKDPVEKRLQILRVRGPRAELEVGHGVGHLFNVHLRKTAAGWRGDSASFQPFGNPFGR